MAAGDRSCFLYRHWKEAVVIKIALCDDESEQLAQTEAFLREYQRQHPGTDLSVSTFSSGILLLEHLRTKETFDLYLLDVIMPGLNGIELGVGIREFDQGGHIIYLTTSADFAVDSYRAKASDYLLKPLDKERLFRALESVMDRLAQEGQAFMTIKTREGLQRLPHWSIVYGELVGRCVHYHLLDGSVVAGISLRGSFQDAVKPLLEHPRFILCSASFFVNLSFVERIEGARLWLAGGRSLPISRTLRTEVTNRWLDHHLGGGE